MQSNQYHLGNAIVVTTTVPDGSWMATFPGFVGLGHTEGEALNDLADQLVDAAKRIASLAPIEHDEADDYDRATGDLGRPLYATRQQVAPTLGAPQELALVWATTESAARMFFGAPTDTTVVVVKDAPETDEEKRRYAPNAKLYGVAYEKRTREFVQATAGVRRNK